MKSSGINLHVKALFILKSATRRLKSYFLLNKIHKTFTRHQVVHLSILFYCLGISGSFTYSIFIGCGAPKIWGNIPAEIVLFNNNRLFLFWYIVSCVYGLVILLQQKKVSPWTLRSLNSRFKRCRVKDTFTQSDSYCDFRPVHIVRWWLHFSLTQWMRFYGYKRVCSHWSQGYHFATERVTIFIAIVSAT